MNAYHLDTMAVHPITTVPSNVPVAVPIYQTSIFGFDNLDAFADAWSRPDGEFSYSRLGNPTVRALEDSLAALEGGVAALVTASGSAAIGVTVLSLLRTGDHVILQEGLYGGTLALFRDLAERWGLRLSVVDVEDVAALEAACVASTRMLYLETIANPMGYVCDIPALTAWARDHDILSVVDNTFATPLLFRPLQVGADVVVHSTTKYIGGHSDVVGGAIVLADEARHRIVWERGSELGASADPFAAWLTLRGLQTLPVRLERQCRSAAVLAERLVRHPSVTAVHWPGLAGHPSHARATRLLSGYGSVLAFDLGGGADAARTFAKRVRLVTLAPSLGGVTTTILSPRATSHSRLSEAELERSGITEGTLRVAVGLEDAGDLWREFAHALGDGPG